MKVSTEFRTTHLFLVLVPATVNTPLEPSQLWSAQLRFFFCFVDRVRPLILTRDIGGLICLIHGLNTNDAGAANVSQNVCIKRAQLHWVLFALSITVNAAVPDQFGVATSFWIESLRVLLTWKSHH